MKSRFVGYDDSTACSVESLVLQHLSLEEEGSWAGWHCEGSPVRVLWTLLMWDVIFADIPDVFQVGPPFRFISPIQTCSELIGQHRGGGAFVVHQTMKTEYFEF